MQDCVKSVKESLEKTDRVRSVDVNLKKGTAVMEHDIAAVDAGLKAFVKHDLFS